jgi:hypothetical protein
MILIASSRITMRKKLFCFPSGTKCKKKISEKNCNKNSHTIYFLLSYWQLILHLQNFSHRFHVRFIDMMFHRSEGKRELKMQLTSHENAVSFMQRSFFMLS